MTAEAIEQESELVRGIRQLKTRAISAEERVEQLEGVLADLEAKCRDAARVMVELSGTARFDDEALRLKHKAEGLRLAAGYVSDYRRTTESLV